MGGIYDEAYDPALKVGDYYFSADTNHGGIFTYGKDQRHGKKPWGCGTLENRYMIAGGETDLARGYGELKYYHTTTTAKGDVWTSNSNAGSGKPQINSLYYQYLIPHWEETSSFGGGNKVTFKLKTVNSNTDVGSASKNGEFGKSLPSEGAVNIKNVADHLETVISAVDDSGGKTPKSYMRFYGIAAMYKAFLVSVENPEKKSFKGSSDTVPMQVKLQCGAQIIQPGSTDNRWIYANTNENDSNIVFTVSKNTVNGADGIFGTIKGYTIKITGSDNDNKVTKTYPSDYIAFLKGKTGKGNTAIDYSADAVNKVIARVNSHLDTVIADKYFVDWIESVQKTTKSAGLNGKSYFQELSFKPIVDYNDVKVMVTEPDKGKQTCDAAFDDSELKKRGQYVTFHAGDKLDLAATSSEGTYRVTGFEVSEDGGAHFNSIRDTRFFTLLPNKNYVFRPLLELNDNHVEIILTEAAKQNLNIEDLIPQEKLAGHSLQGKYVLNLNPSETTADKMMKTAVGDACTVKALVTGKPSENGYVYRPVFKDRMTGRTYGSQAYSFIQRSNTADNVIEVDVEKVKIADIKEHSISGTVVSSLPSVRVDGLGLHSNPAEGYMVSMANGEIEVIRNGVKEKHVGFVSASAGSDGAVNISGVKAKEGDRISLLIDNGMNDAQVVELVIKGTETDPVSMVTKVNAGMINIQYPANAPRVTNLIYDYGKTSSRQKVDLRNNQVRCFDDNLTLSASIDPKGRAVEKLVFTVRTVTGATADYEAKPTENDPNLFTVTINAMLDNLHNGDRITVYAVDKEKRTVTTASGTQQADIVYPTVETGLVAFVENEVIAPKEFVIDEDMGDINIPLLGAAKGSAQSGILNFSRIDYPDKQGFSLNINLDMMLNRQSLTSEQKKDAVRNFTRSVTNNAKKKKEAAIAGEEAENAGYNAEQIRRMMQDGGELSPEMEQRLNDYEARREEAERIRDEAETQAKNERTNLTKTKGVVDVRVLFNLSFEFLYDPVRQEYVLATAAVTVGGAVVASKTMYTMIGYVPCFLNISGGVEADITMGGVCPEGKNAYSEGDFNGYQGNIRQMFTGSDFLTEFDTVGKLKLQVGAGLCGVLSARGYVKAEMQLQFVQNNISEHPYGVILDCAGGIGFDLVLMSFNMDVAKVSWGWGNFAGRTGVSYFNNTVKARSASASANSASGTNTASEANSASGRALSEANAFAESYSMQTADELSVSDYSMGTSDMSNFAQEALNAQPVPVSKQVLLRNAADRTRPELITLPDGRQFAVFIGASDNGDNSRLYYTVRGTSGVWSTPKPVESDGTYDSMPDLILKGDKVIITWMDGSTKLETKTDLKDRYNAFRISGAVYDISSNTMSEAFKVSADADEPFYNQAPKLSIAGDRVFCTYLTRDLENVAKPEQLADLRVGYSTMRRAELDLSQIGSSSGSVAGNHEYVVIKHQTKTDPLVIDYQTEGITVSEGGSSSDYLITAYTIDEDNDLTTPDRNLYLGIRDLNDTDNTDPSNPKPKDYYPIRIRSEESCQAVPKLSRINDTLVLSWTSDGKLLELLDVSTLLKTLFHNTEINTTSGSNAYKKSDVSEQDWYKRTASELGLSYEYYANSYYMDLCNDNFRTVETPISNNEEHAASIDDYSVVTDGRDIYVFYTDIDPSSENAAVELYGRRYRQEPSDHSIAEEHTGEVWGFTDSVKITDFGKVIDDFDLVMDSRGNISLLCDYYDQWIDDDGKIAFSSNSLAEIDFKTAGSLDIREVSLGTDDHMIIGEYTAIELELANYGLMEAKGFTLKAELKGNGGASSEIFNKSYETVLDTNETIRLQMPWIVPDTDLNGCSVILHVSEKNTAISSETTAEIQLSSKERLRLSMGQPVPGSESVRVTGTIRNIGNASSEPCTVYAYISADAGGEGERLAASSDIPALGSGEEKEFELEYSLMLSDWNGFGSTEVRLTAVRNGTELCSDTEDIYSSKPVMLDIDNGLDSILMNEGTSASLISTAAPWNSLCSDIVYFSSDNSVATVSGSGTVSAHSSGTCIVTAYSPAYGVKDSISVTVNKKEDQKEEGIIDEPVKKNYSDSNDDSGVVSQGTIYADAAIPSWVESSGSWEMNADGTWKYMLNGESVKDSWFCVVNPYASQQSGQKKYGWFKFDPSGNMLTGWFTDSDGNVYYLNPLSDNTMGMMLVGWQLINGSWYYFSEAEGSGTMGAMLRNTVTPDGYRVNSDGVWVR
ncbi:MAG: Ig-like domain-containing protein [Eubacteriales bacterium]|nr:Ig-like domain-containing protein [Eubacteriales bacterium]